MDKKTLIEQIQSHLLDELRDIQRKLEEPHPEAGLGDRVHEIEALLTMYRFMPIRDYSDEDVACPASLVELETQGTRAWYFIAPKGGGLVTSLDGKAVQVITPNSPIGDALLGKHVGDTIDVQTRGALRRYQVVAIR